MHIRCALRIRQAGMICASAALSAVAVCSATTSAGLDLKMHPRKHHSSTHIQYVHSTQVSEPRLPIQPLRLPLLRPNRHTHTRMNTQTHAKACGCLLCQGGKLDSLRRLCRLCLCNPRCDIAHRHTWCTRRTLCLMKLCSRRHGSLFCGKHRKGTRRVRGRGRGKEKKKGNEELESALSFAACTQKGASKRLCANAIGTLRHTHEGGRGGCMACRRCRQRCRLSKTRSPPRMGRSLCPPRPRRHTLALVGMTQSILPSHQRSQRHDRACSLSKPAPPQPQPNPQPSHTTQTREERMRRGASHKQRRCCFLVVGFRLLFVFLLPSTFPFRNAFLFWMDDNVQ